MNDIRELIFNIVLDCNGNTVITKGYQKPKYGLHDNDDQDLIDEEPFGWAEP